MGLRKLFYFYFLYMYISSSALTIVIDPGHGGIFSGATSINNKIIEKTIALSLAQELMRVLQAEKHKVVLTRSTDTQLKDELLDDLMARVDVARTVSADIFLSLHCNASVDAGVQGVELYVPYTDTGFPGQSYMLASCVHAQLIKVVPALWTGNLGNLNKHDRGIRAARFNVLAHNPAPAAVLIEFDYLSNSQAESRLQDTVYQQQLINALKSGILCYTQNTSTKK